MRFVRSAVALAGTIVACSSAAPSPAPQAQPGGPHPRLLYTADQKEAIALRLGREPFATLWQRVRDRAAEPAQTPEPGTWVTGVWSANAQIAQANAVLAWALGDAAAGAKARDLLLALGSNYEDAREVDIDIKIGRILVPYTNAWDLLCATPFLNAAESREAQARLTTITRGFVSAHLDGGLQRVASFIVTQDNHPLRAVAAVGYVALAFPDDPDAGRWSDWAKDTLDYLLGPKGHYVQADGAVSEGPFYYAFGFSAFLPYLIALDHAPPPAAGDERASASHRVCITRNTADPWTDNGCVDGEAFTFVNPLRGPALASTVDWSIALRRPSGLRAELDDASIPVLNGGALMTSFGGASYTTWDWQTNETQALETTRFDDLTPWYLAYVTDAAPEPPPWKNRFFPAGGQAIFRSGWGTKDLWLTLVADSGPARKSLHNHADGTSFALAAYGEDLLIDTGYYKPDSSRNPLTTDAPSHNVVLVDGLGAPKRGLLNDWGDTDAFLENTHDGERVAWAEARITYRDMTLRRGVAFARNRYFVVADRIASARPEARTFQWRAHLWAGHDAGGAYALDGDRLTLDRARGGLLVAASTTDGKPTFVEPAFAPLTPPSVHSVDGTPGDHAVADATIAAVSPSFLVVLAPYAEGASGADGPLVVTGVDAGTGASAWTVEGSGFRDVAWLRAKGASSRLELAGGHVLETDAEVVVASVDGAYALVAGGSTLTLDGRALVSGNGAPVVVVGD